MTKTEHGKSSQFGGLSCQVNFRHDTGEREHSLQPPLSLHHSLQARGDEEAEVLLGRGLPGTVIRIHTFSMMHKQIKERSTDNK